MCLQIKAAEIKAKGQGHIPHKDKAGIYCLLIYFIYYPNITGMLSEPMRLSYPFSKLPDPFARFKLLCTITL